MTVTVESTPEPISEAPATAPVAAPSADNGNRSLSIALVVGVILFGIFVNWTLPAIIAGLLFMLFMHELGHFITARWSGMQVTEFFLGFGPKIWSFNRGEVEYGLKSIPAGAYVRITGMTNLENVNPAMEHRTYRAQPYWQRMMTISAGSFMHFAMAFAALVVMFASFSYPGIQGYPWEVDRIVPGSTADALGIQTGDRIVSVNGDQTRSWQEFSSVVTKLRVEPIEVEVDRAGETLNLSGVMGARSDDVVGSGFGLLVDDPFGNEGWTVEQVWPESNAESLGFEVGDAIMKVGEVELPSQSEVAVLLFQSDGEPLDFVVDRDGAEMVFSGQVDLDRSTEFRGFFGVGLNELEGADVGTGEAIGLAAQDFGSLVWQNLVGLKNLPGNLVDYVSGGEVEPAPRTSAPSAPSIENESQGRPISMVGIGRMFFDAEGALEVLFLFMVVNVFVGIFNLLPLLPLDGGHAAVATYERLRELITRRPHRVDAAKLIPLTWAVLFVLVGFGVWAMALDIFSWPPEQ